MDPNKIQLTFKQKIKSLLLAINAVWPWHITLLIMISIAVGIIAPAYIPITPGNPLILDFIFRRVALGILLSLLTGLVIYFFHFMYEAAMLPFINEIKSHYNRFSLEEKKHILDNIIDNEILKRDEK